MITLPELPFDPTSLGDFTSTETFEYHHGKHHAGYVKKLNVALEGKEYAEKSLEGIIASSRDEGDLSVFNNAAQHFNHSLFWNCLSPEGTAPSEQLAELIDRDFESLDKFKAEFSESALRLFGSGWAWLVQNENGSLSIEQFKDADTPAGTGQVPLLTLDVWEHAYYIDHRNDRAGFIEKFWGYVNWEHVGAQLK